MTYLCNDALPVTACIVVKLDDGTLAIFEHYLCQGELAALIDKDDHHRFIVNASRIVKIEREGEHE